MRTARLTEIQHFSYSVRTTSQCRPRTGTQGGLFLNTGPEDGGQDEGNECSRWRESHMDRHGVKMIWPTGRTLFKSSMPGSYKRKFWSTVWYSTWVQKWELIGLNMLFFFSLVSAWRASLSDGNRWWDTSFSLIPSADVPRKIIFLFLMGRSLGYQNTCTLESGFQESRLSKASFPNKEALDF